MQIYYTNRDISSKLSIPIAKWKRWSREFLPPDPLGGYQSGFARHFSLREAFTVFVGGYLVSELRLTVPEAKTILKHLDGWTKRHIVSRAGFPCLANGHRADYDILIRSSDDGKRSLSFGCSVRQKLSSTERREGGLRVVEDRFILTEITPAVEAAGLRPAAVRVLRMTRVARWFAEKMGISNGRGDLIGLA
jgi:hypothetical protein